MVNQIYIDAKDGDDEAIVIGSVGIVFMLGLGALGVYFVVNLKRKIESLQKRSGGDTPAAKVSATAGSTRRVV